MRVDPPNGPVNISATALPSSTHPVDEKIASRVQSSDEVQIGPQAERASIAAERVQRLLLQLPDLKSLVEADGAKLAAADAKESRQD